MVPSLPDRVVVCIRRHVNRRRLLPMLVGDGDLKNVGPRWQAYCQVVTFVKVVDSLDQSADGRDAQGTYRDPK